MPERTPSDTPPKRTDADRCAGCSESRLSAIHLDRDLSDFHVFQARVAAEGSQPSGPTPDRKELLHPTLVLEVFQQDWIPGFAAFKDDGSVENNAKAHIVLNIGAFITAVATKDLPRTDIPYIIAETIMHEAIHALEAWAAVEFSEERVEALIEKYRDAAKEAGL